MACKVARRSLCGIALNVGKQQPNQYCQSRYGEKRQQHADAKPDDRADHAAGRQSRAAAGVTAADFSAGNDAQRHAGSPQRNAVETEEASHRIDQEQQAGQYRTDAQHQRSDCQTIAAVFWGAADRAADLPPEMSAAARRQDSRPYHFAKPARIWDRRNIRPRSKPPPPVNNSIAYVG